MRLIAYTPDALALLYFSLKRLFPDRRFAKQIVDEAFRRLKPNPAPAGAEDGLVRLIAFRLEFEAVRRDAQGATLAALAGLIAKADTPGMWEWVVGLLTGWACLFVINQVINVPVDGIRQMKTRKWILIGFTMVFVGFTASIKFVMLHHPALLR